MPIVYVCAVLVIIIYFILLVCICRKKKIDVTDFFVVVGGEEEQSTKIKGEYVDVSLADNNYHIFNKKGIWYYKTSCGEEKKISFDCEYSPNINENESGRELCLKAVKNKRVDGHIAVGFSVGYWVCAILVVFLFLTLKSQDDSNMKLPDDPQYEDDNSKEHLENFVSKIDLGYEINVPWNTYIQQGQNRRVVENNKETTFGICVSYYQQDINWKTVAEQGVDYAIVRIGYRGYEEGNICEDPNFDVYMHDAIESGIDVGGYFFSQAINKAEMDDEIEYILERIKKYHVTYPVGISLNRFTAEGSEEYRANVLTDEEYIELLKYYCIRMKEEGYTPVIYFSDEEEYNKLPKNSLDGYLLWMTNMTSKINRTEDVLIWQYRNYIVLPGVEKKVSCGSCGLQWLSQ